MLLAGGYFRARITTLSPFDRVVGGLVWSITASNVELDVDLLFEENSTIGQRIRLSDNIIKALVKMQCPHALQSHQIQGLDYDHLFPVIQWLVRQVIETRQLTGDTIRAQSVFQFAKHHVVDPTKDVPAETSVNTVEDVRNLIQKETQRTALAESFVGEASNRYKAKRKYKKRADAVFESEVARVEATLLEFGENLYGRAAMRVIDEEKAEKDRARQQRRGQSSSLAAAAAALGQPTQGSVDDSAETQERLRQEEEAERERISALQGQLFDVGAKAVSGSAIGHMVTLRADDIRDATAAYDEDLVAAAAAAGATVDESGVLITGTKDAKKAEEALHRRKTDQLRRKAAELKSLLQAKLAPLEEARAKHAEQVSLIQQKQEEIAAIEAKLAEIEAAENNEANQEVIAKLRALVTLNESLKKQEQDFKAMAKAELQRLQDMIRTYDSADGDEELKKVLDVENIYESDLAKITKLRQLLAKRKQEIAKITRQIDEIPTRSELLQFERRFMELYELNSETYQETQKYYGMYNSLATSYEYLQRELTILETIIAQFPTGMKTPQNQETMIKQLDIMMQGVRKSTQDVHSKLDSVTQNKEALEAQYAKLLEKQRTYFRLVKEFKEECTLNEKLVNKIESLKS